jgi:putative transposase
MGRVLGGQRGRLITLPERQQAVKLIQVSMAAGARLTEACKLLEISVRTYYRWQGCPLVDKRKGATKQIPRKLTVAERAEVLKLCCSERFKDSPPYEIVLTLLEENKYLASIRSFYRILKEANLLHHRCNSRAPKSCKAPQEQKATGPNQVWCWDITWLPTPVKGIFLYAYVIIDIWDKSIVGWAIHEREDALFAAQLFNELKSKYKLTNVHLHSDNGHPMRGMSLLALLYYLEVTVSFSRPRVSNDNPFIESFFKTMKYNVRYPKHFADLKAAREWLADFVDWYNNQHRHSALAYVTPEQMRNGEYRALYAARNKTMQEAYEKKSYRWSTAPKQWSVDHVVYLNPTSETKAQLKRKKNAA